MLNFLIACLCLLPIRCDDKSLEKVSTIDESDTCKAESMAHVDKLQAKIQDLQRSDKKLQNEVERLRSLSGDAQSDEDIYRALREKKIVEGLKKLSNKDKVGVDAVELMKMFYTMFFNKERQRPVFLVTYGPPGSGKSYMLKKVARQYNYDIERNFIKVLQDDMMKSMNEYNEEMDVMNSTKHLYTNEQGQVNRSYFEKANSVYWKYRSMVIQMKQMLLDVAYRQELNIVYETTGSKRENHPNQSLFNTLREARARGYKIVIIYPYVQNYTLVQRLEERNKKQVRVLDPSKLSLFQKKAKANFVHYLGFADAGYVYDNNLGKSTVSRELPWLLKYHQNATHKDYKCAPEICQYEIWKQFQHEDTKIPVCKEFCEKV